MLQRGVDAGQDPLRRGLLVAGRAIDLAGEKQARDRLGLERALQVARVEEVVLDRIAGARQMRLLEAANAAHELLLHVERQAGGDAVRIDLVRVEPFGLDEELMRALVGEAMHLVLDRGAVARAGALDRAGEHRRAIEGGTNDRVRALVGVRDVAGHLARMLPGAAQEREHRQRRIEC